MSSKKKKNLIWLECPFCHIWLFDVDYNFHKENEVCLKDQHSDLIHQMNSCQHKFFGLKFLNKKLEDNFQRVSLLGHYKALLNPMTMLEFQLNIDEPVSVNNSFVCYVWPDIKISTHFFSMDISLLDKHAALALNLSSSSHPTMTSNLNALCVMQKLDLDQVLDLTETKFMIMNEIKSNFDKTNLKTMLRFQLVGMFVKLGMKIELPFFMDNFILKVVHIKMGYANNSYMPSCNDCTVEHHKEYLNHAGGDDFNNKNFMNARKCNWFKITKSTKIELILDNDDEDGEVKIDRVVSRQFNGLTFDSLVGFDVHKQYLKSLLDQSLTTHSTIGCLICGPSGSGRSSLGYMLSTIYEDLPFTYLCSFQLMTTYESEGRLGVLRQVLRLIDCGQVNIVFIDDLDNICPASSSLANEAVNDASHDADDLKMTMLEALDSLFKSPRCNFLVASAESLHSDWLTTTRFNYSIQLETPTGSERLQILKKCINEMMPSSSSQELSSSSSSSSSTIHYTHSLTDDDVTSLSSSCHAFLAQDLHLLCQHAMISAQLRFNKNATNFPFNELLSTSLPTSLTTTSTTTAITTTAITTSTKHLTSPTAVTRLTDGIHSLTISTNHPTTYPLPCTASTNNASSIQATTPTTTTHMVTPPTTTATHMITPTTSTKTLTLTLTTSIATPATTSMNIVITPLDFLSSHMKLRGHINRNDAMIVELVTWSDIAGYEDLKQTIRESLEWPIKYAHLFSQHHIPAPSGLLLYGPPGCSKTMIAKAVATQCGFNFFAVKGSELLSKYVGQSEKNVRNLFGRARKAAPSVIFFDEIESLVATRESSDVNSTNSLLSAMLTEMDGMVALCGVFVLGATNMPHRVDKALLRPGRLSRSIYVPLPPAHTRHLIFEKHFKKMPTSADVLIDVLVDKTERFSGAEIVKLCRQAVNECLLEDISKQHVEMKHFLKVLDHLKPVATNEMLASYEDFKKLC